MFRVRLTDEALDDLRRLEDFLIDRALDSGDLRLPIRAVAAIRRELALLERNPFTCRMAADDPHERELVIPFGPSGYVALFHIIGPEDVVVSALRHQREDDFH